MGRSESQSSQLLASSGQRGGDTPKQIGGQQEEEEYRGERSNLDSTAAPQHRKTKKIRQLCTFALDS